MALADGTDETPMAAAGEPRPGLLRQFLPRRIFARSLIIVVAPMVLLQAAITYLFLDQHEARTTGYLTRGVVDQIALVVQLIEPLPGAAEREAMAAAASSKLGLSVTYLPGAALPQEPGTTTTAVGEVIDQHMKDRLIEAYWFDAKRFGDYVDLRVQTPEGVVRFLIERKRFININMHLFPVWMVVFSLVLGGVAIIFLRNQIRPIQRLALAAENFGRGRDVPDFKPAGATEVRQAAIAFLEMRERISRQMAQRTEMLAGVSHDLKTPLTRMKLELAMMPESDETAMLRADVAEMEHMLEEYLAFARGEGGETTAPADLGALAQDVVDDARRQSAAADVTLSTSGDLMASVRRNAIKRCLTNLVENALKYGSRAVITARRMSGAIEIAVDDNGPGIPEADREEAFKPFRRLDAARNLDRGGVGLGLAIARDIARSHGGEIWLASSALGGLRAELRIPV